MPNSDTIQGYNEIPSIEAGNLLLRHWAPASDNFYLTDLPIFACLRFLVGDRPALTFVVPFLIFSLLLLACVLLVRGESPREQRNVGTLSVLFLLGLPFSGSLEIWFQTGIHIATLMFCLYAVLMIRPILRGRSVRGVRLVLFSGLIAAAAASDPLTDAVLLAPLLALLLIRISPNPACRRQQAVLAVCVVAGIAVGAAFVPIISGLGGFTTSPSFTTRLVASMSELRSNLTAIRGAVEILCSARNALLRQVLAHQAVAACRSLTILCVIVLCIRILWRSPKMHHEGVAQCLVPGALCLLVLDAMSASFTAAISFGATFPGAAIRYVVPVYLFGSIAAAIEFQSVWASVSWRP